MTKCLFIVLKKDKTAYFKKAMMKLGIKFVKSHRKQ